MMRGIFGVIFAAAACWFLWMFWVFATPVTPANVETRMVQVCKAIKLWVGFSINSEQMRDGLLGADCGCVSARLIDKHGKVFAADMVEEVRKDMAARLSGAVEVRENSDRFAARLMIIGPKMQRFGQTLATAGKYCPGGQG